MKKAVVAAAIAALCLPAAALAQTRATLEAAYEAAQAEKKMVVSMNLGLTDAEGEKFWPLYAAFQKELASVEMREMGVVKKFAEHYDAMTDETAKKLLEEYFKIEEDRLKMRQAWVAKFRDAVGAKKTVRYYQIENKIDAIKDFSAVEAIPLMK